MIDARARAVEMLEVSRRVMAHRVNGAEKISEFENLANALESLLVYHDSYRSSCFRLVDRVAALFGVVSNMSSGPNGQTLAESLPDGAGPMFKRAMVELWKEIKSHETK